MSGQPSQSDIALRVGAVGTGEDGAMQAPRGSYFEQESGQRMSLNDPISISVYSPSNAELSPQPDQHQDVHVAVPTPSPPRSLREPTRNELPSRSRSTERSPSSRSHGTSSDPPPLPRAATQQAHEDESTGSSRRRARLSHAYSAPPVAWEDDVVTAEPKPFTAVDPFAPRKHRLSWSSILRVKDSRRRPARNPSDAWTHPVSYAEDEDPYTFGGDMDDRNSSEEAVLDGERLSGIPNLETQISDVPGSVHPSGSSEGSFHSFEEEKIKKNTTFQDSLPLYNSKPNVIARVDTVQPAPSVRFDKQATADSIPLNTIGASDTTSEAQEISLFAWLVAYFPSRMYLYFLLGVPRLYFTRVANIFEDANLQKDQMERLVLQNASARRNPRLPAFRSEAFMQLTASWTHFIDTLLREWKTMNLISVLLLSAIVSLLQIEAAFLDPIVHYAALFSLVSALMSLLYGCMYILRFNTMRMPHKAIQWAQEARREQPNPFWNVWILLAIPAVWLVWSLLFYIVCIMAFVWRVESGSNPPQFSDEFILAIRVGISVALGVGIVYGVVVLRTFFNFGAAMDKRFKKSLDLFMKQQQLRMPHAHSRPPTVKDISTQWLREQLAHRDHYSETSNKSRASRPSMYSFKAHPVPTPAPNPPFVEEVSASLPAGRALAPQSHVHFKRSLEQVKVMTPVQEGLGAPHSITDVFEHSPRQGDKNTNGLLHQQTPTQIPPPQPPINPVSSPAPVPCPGRSDVAATTLSTFGDPHSGDPPQGPLSDLALPLSPPLSVHTRGATSSSTSSGQGTSTARNSPSQRLPARRLLQPHRAETLPSERAYQQLRSLEEGQVDNSQSGGNRPGPSPIQVSSAPLLAPPDPSHHKEAIPPGGLGIALAGSPSPWPRPAQRSKSSAEPDLLTFSPSSGPPYDVLLPHARYPIVYRGVQYPSALHLHYALPFLEHHTDVVERIRMCEDPAELRLLSQNFATYLQSEDLSDTAVKLVKVQTLKFQQHPNLAEVLIRTGDRNLVYYDSEDLLLGVDGAKGSRGRNELGKALMRVRHELKIGSVASARGVYSAR